MGFDDDHGDIRGMKTQCCLSVFGSPRAWLGTTYKSLVHRYSASSLLGIVSMLATNHIEFAQLQSQYVTCICEAS